MSSAPVVAHIGPNGWLGKNINAVFVDAVKSGDFAKLKILTSKESDTVKQAISAAPGKVEAAILDYTNKSALEEALKGVDIVINTIGGHGGQAPAEQALIESIAKVGGVKAYFNSDFGTDYDPETWGSSAYEAKKAHRAAAEKLGIKTIAIAVSAFEQSFRSELFGINGNDWEISGDGNYPFGLTDIVDIGRYTARAAILAYNDPDKVPSRLRIYSDLKTINEYAEILEKVTGQKINKTYVPRQQFVDKWEAGLREENPYYVLRLAAESSGHNFTGISHNELLNPGQKYFKPKSWEEYVSEK